MSKSLKTRAIVATLIGGIIVTVGGAAIASTTQTWTLTYTSGDWYEQRSVPGCVIDTYLYPSYDRARTYNYAGCSVVYARHYWIDGLSGGYTAWKSSATDAWDSVAANIYVSYHKADY